MANNRLDVALVEKGLVPTRSQALSYIKLGLVRVNDQIVTKPGQQVNTNDKIKLNAGEQYVSRAALKLDSVAEALNINFKNKIVLDVGSSTGGFSDYALKHGAKKVVAVDVGTNQMHPNLRSDKRIELHEQTDIRNFVKDQNQKIDIVVIDVSFISLTKILPAVISICQTQTLILAMVKPQFEATQNNQKSRGIIKNEHIRREIFKEFEIWVQKLFKILGKADSSVSGEKGNKERFYLIKAL